MKHENKNIHIMYMKVLHTSNFIMEGWNSEQGILTFLDNRKDNHDQTLTSEPLIQNHYMSFNCFILQVTCIDDITKTNQHWIIIPFFSSVKLKIKTTSKPYKVVLHVNYKRTEWQNARQPYFDSSGKTDLFFTALDMTIGINFMNEDKIRWSVKTGYKRQM